jgi:ribosomal protein S18 acetylase RimI-like enzyme
MSNDRPAQFGWKRAAELGLSFRPMAKGDLLFSGLVYAASRKPQLAELPWSDAQKALFLLLTFRAQHAYFRREYPEADWMVVMDRVNEIGRLFLDCEPEAEHHRIIDLSFLPRHHGHGYEEAVLRDLMDEAAAAGKPLAAEIEKQGAAIELYRQLGFVTIEDRGDYDLLRWKP